MRLMKLILVMLVCASGPAVAGLFEDGEAAFSKGDYATALQLWQPLAQQGDARAQNGLGALYQRGLGVPQDLAEAMRWYQKAATPKAPKPGDSDQKERTSNPLSSVARAGQGCSLDEALIRVTLFALREATQPQQLTILKRFSELNDKATNPNLPTGAQLSGSDQLEFEDLSFRISKYRLQNLHFSNIQRDAEVIRNAIRVGEEAYKGNFPTKESGDERYLGVYGAIEYIMPPLPITRNKSATGCSMVEAIDQYQERKFPAVTLGQVQQIVAEAQSLQEKYGTGNAQGWPERIPEGSDKVRARHLYEVIATAKAEIVFFNSLEKLKFVQNMSDKQYSMLAEYLNSAKSKSDLEQISSVLSKVADPNSEAEKNALLVLSVISEEFPSMAQKSFNLSFPEKSK